jgi:CarD family transcriptional regulator
MVDKGRTNPAKSTSGANKSPPATPTPSAARPKVSAGVKPKPATVTSVTSATKPKPEPKSPAKPAKPAESKAEAVKPPPAKAAKAAAEQNAPEPAVQSSPPEPAKVVAAPEPEAESAEVAKPTPPAPAPITHSGVPAGPMRPQTPPRAMAKAEIFVDGDFVVYPTHGVGKVERIATEEIAGHTLELIHITFDENRMTLRVPTNKARTAGLRKLASRKQFDEVLATLKGRARIKRTMWSRRAQEYEAKINSGDPSAIAEVVRDLHRNAGQPDQSFSERQIYESALDRLAAEYGALEQVDKATATERLIAHLKSE